MAIGSASPGALGVNHGGGLPSAGAWSDHDGDSRPRFVVHLLWPLNPCVRNRVGERTSQAGDAGARANRGKAEEFLYSQEVTSNFRK
jgi:hypothetical protein